MRITSAAPPSSGGVVLLIMLNILEGYDLGALEPAERTHLIIEAMRRAYRERAEYLGDPDFVDMPLEKLMHPWYAAGLARDIRLDRATASVPETDPKQEGTDTTHFSILTGKAIGWRRPSVSTIPLVQVLSRPGPACC